MVRAEAMAASSTTWTKSPRRSRSIRLCGLASLTALMALSSYQRGWLSRPELRYWTLIVQPESDLYAHRHAHGMAALRPRLEAPGVQGLDGLLIETRIDRLLHMDILRLAGFIDRR